MGQHRTGFVVAIIATLALLMGACGGGSSDDATPATSGTTAGPAADDGGNTPGVTTAPDDDSDDGETQEPTGGGDLSLVPAGATDILGNPAGQGFVELNGVRYDFLLDSTCRNVFGGLQTGGPLADGSDGRVDSFIPPEDWASEAQAAAEWDPPLIEVDIGGDSWMAKAGSQQFVGEEYVDLTPEQSSVMSFSNDGSLVAGEATFVNSYNVEEIESVTGTFEFYCP